MLVDQPQQVILGNLIFQAEVINKGLNSNPHAIPLFQSCNDAPRKVLAFVLAAMPVKVHDLSPTTELNIHTAFRSAIAGELRRRPLMRVIYRVDTHRRLPPRVQRCSGVVLEPEQKPDEKPSRIGKSPPVRFRVVDATAIIEQHSSSLRGRHGGRRGLSVDRSHFHSRWF